MKRSGYQISPSGAGEEGDLGEEVMSCIACALGSLFFAVYHIKMSDRSYVCFREDMDSILPQIGKHGNADESFAFYIDSYIEPEDAPGMREFVDLDTLPERMAERDMVAHEYRRLGLGWTCARFLVSRRDELGRPKNVVFVVADISKEKMLAAKEEIAFYSSRHDALTGAYNRTAFEEAAASHLYAGEPVGFALLDVDSFKSINDEHGHGFGDEALSKVVQAISSAFRSEDRVFRIGGDEFAIIMKGCGRSSWGRICEKFERIHRSLSVTLPRVGDVTLSAGVCFGSSGFDDWMYEVADKGLYCSKKKGRAGCTLMNEDGTVADVWRDDDAVLRPFSALSGASSGMCRLEFPQDKSIHPRFFCGDGLRRLYRIPNGLSPEERYDYWKAGVDPAYDEMLARARKEMMVSENVECTFLWGCDREEPILVRAVGAGRIEGDTDIIYGLHRSLEGARFIEQGSKVDLIIKAQNRAYVCSYVVDLRDGTLSILKQSPTAWTVDMDGLDARASLIALSKKLVCDQDLERVLAFLDTSTLPERMRNEAYLTCEYLSTTDSGWCQGSWYPIEYDESGELLSVMFTVASIDSAKQREMQRERELAESRALHYEAAETMLGTKVLAMVLFDRETGEGKAWTRSNGFSQSAPVTYDSLLQRDADFVEEGKRSEFLGKLEMKRVVSKVASAGLYERTVKFIAPNGVTRYFTYHYSEYSHDASRLFVVVEDSTAIHVQEGRRVEDIYDNVPGGLVSYELSGNGLELLHVSRRYRSLFGDVASSASNTFGIDYDRVHPDDLPAYVENVVYALEQGREVHHSYRIRVNDQRDWIWVKVDGVAKETEDDRTLVYAMYSDITELMEAKIGLDKASESLESALKTANQIIWEYDPIEHLGICYTEQNAFGLPKVIQGYPESLGSFNIFDQDGLQTFCETARKIDDGAEEAACDVLIRAGGERRWFSCKFFARFDPIAGKRTATLFVTDINVRMNASKVFQNRMKSILCSNDSALSIGVYNISKGEVLEANAREGFMSKSADKYTYDDVLALAANGIVDPEDRQKYLQTFSRENLLALASVGEMKTSMECLYRVAPGHTEWMEVSVDLMIDPLSGDVDGIGSVKSVNELRLSGMFIRQSLKGTFNSASLLFDNGAEYYLYDDMMNSICEHHVDYWGDLRKVLQAICDKDEFSRVEPLVAKERLLGQLAVGEIPRITFSGSFGGKSCRVEYVLSKVEGRQGVIYASMRDITDAAMLEKLKYDSRHDSLTGLLNRSATFELCERLLRDNPDLGFAMIKLDVRRFRLYNAFFGEEAGDHLLKTIASQLKDAFGGRSDCAFGRLEADVFCLFLPYDEGVFGTYLEAIEARFANFRADFPLEPTIGVYLVADRSMPIEAMFARATTAAKEGGTRLSKRAWRYNDELEHHLNMELSIENEMQAALDQEQFAVYLQPKYDLQTGGLAGAEALVRWIHPVRGKVSPGDFIPLFERNGFITSLDRYMWEHVCKLLRKWIDEGRDPKPVSVNVSRVSAYSPASVPFLLDLVKRYDIDPALMELELTESAYMEDPDQVLRSMRIMQEAGFRILMDDFGSGYSSLNALRNLPVDVLKLDIGFLSEAYEGERGRAVVDSVFAMTERLGIPVIAEGVEREEQADYLRSAGCEYVQGYLYARPMPVEDYEKLS